MPLQLEWSLRRLGGSPHGLDVGAADDAMVLVLCSVGDERARTGEKTDPLRAGSTVRFTGES